MNTYRAELMIISKRTSTWVLLGVMLIMTGLFAYALPYASSDDVGEGVGWAQGIGDLLPQSIVSNLLQGMPFYLGMISLVLGAMALGSEFNWKTIKTTLLQTSNRGEVVASKFAALVSIIAVFTVANFAMAAVCSVIVALVEGQDIAAPPLDDLGLGLGAGWLILSLWAAFGAMLGTLTRGTAMAIGLGVLYGFLLEGLLGGFVTDINGLGDVSYAFLRTNAYSLIQGLGAAPTSSGEPGAFDGPFVNEWQALAVILVYIAGFAGLTGFLFARRDVS